MSQKSQRLDLTVRGGRADRLEELKDDLEDRLGYEVTWPRVMDELIEEYERH